MHMPSIESIKAAARAGTCLGWHGQPMPGVIVSLPGATITAAYDRATDTVTYFVRSGTWPGALARDEEWVRRVLLSPAHPVPLGDTGGVVVSADFDANGNLVSARDLTRRPDTCL